MNFLTCAINQLSDEFLKMITGIKMNTILTEIECANRPFSQKMGYGIA
jgi:hypothetical protein